MDITSIVTAFLLVFLAEMGDKTQLTVISLSCRHSAIQVFSGAILGLLLVDGVSILVGASIAAIVPIKWITITSGIVFVLFGIFTLLSKKQDETEIKEKDRFPMLTSFYLVALSELGDKTQIAAIALAAETSWDSVLLGVMMAFALSVGIGAFLGAKILTRLPKKWLRIISASLFIVLGTLSIVSAILEISIL
jgi:putative Ca2+/H+ antiporter (TMEM165/GDT1 family)